MTSKDFIERCKEEVVSYFTEHVDKTDAMYVMQPEDVYVVWYCKTLQNHKALLSTPAPDGMYYECTFNGDKNELYFDAYKKFENRCVHIR